MKPNLVTVCGHNTTMLRHMLNHYKDIIDDIGINSNKSASVQQL